MNKNDPQIGHWLAFFLIVIFGGGFAVYLWVH